MALVSEIYPPEVWAIESLMVLRDNLVMAGLVHRNFESEVAQAGDTVRTRKPQKLVVKDFAQQSGTDVNLDLLAVDNLNAREITVVLDKHKYTAFIVEDRDEATSIKDLREDFIIPAIDPISQQVDDDLMAEYQDGTDVEGNPVALAAAATIGAGDPLDESDVIEGRRALFAQQCPASPRSLVLGTQHEADLIGRPLFHQANTAGTTAALREANLGRAFGFETYMSQNMPLGNNTDNAAAEQSYAFHRNVLALVMRPLPQIPPGVGAISATRTIDNIALRVTTSYEHRAKGVVSSFDVLYGEQLLDANLGVIISP